MKPLDLIRSDLYRYAGSVGTGAFIRKFVSSEGFNYSVWFRLASGYSRGLSGVLLRIILRRKQRQFGIVIPVGTRIGPGLYIGHFGTIVVNETAVIGANCNLSQGVTIGSNHGQAATIGDNVYIGPNVCIVENVLIGDSVTIGAGSVVTSNVPSNVTVAGAPARVVSDDLARKREGRYIVRRWAAPDIA
ncbi:MULTISPECIES: serine O-acetyltransferase [unclassified Caballeronia]|uniref:serine O-acetyltransferase n=1 Tax=unclassified Caballeronia TaxID=2646786 RepID=UPI002029AD5A|nr:MULTISPECIES: serine acetyltransferase [unclassified Caballeronia]